jgi:hypothetical protein
MEVRPNSHPERSGKFMKGTTATDSIIRGPSHDIPPDAECCTERLIQKRAQNLKDGRAHLKDRLHDYFAQRAINKWSPPKYPRYSLFAARLQSFDTWSKKPLLPSPEHLAEAGFYYAGLCYGFFTYLFEQLFYFVHLL